MSFPGGSDGKESTWNVGDLGLIHGLERCPRAGNSYPLQYSCLDDSMDRGAWQATVHRVAKSQTWLSDFHFFTTHHVRKREALTVWAPWGAHLNFCKGPAGPSQVTLEVKNQPGNAVDIRDTDSIPRWRSPEEGNGNPLQYSCLENCMDQGAIYDGLYSWGHKESDMTEHAPKD